MDRPTHYETLVEQGLEELRLKTAAHDRTWHLGEAAWSMDQDAGTITFDAGRGVVATAPVQVVGTYNTVDGTWLWGWDHPSVDPALQEHARRVRQFGLAHGIAPLVTPKLTCTQDEAWAFTAVACKLCDAQGAYRGPAGTALVYMTFGEVRLTAAGEGSASGAVAAAADATADVEGATVADKLAGLGAADEPDVVAFLHRYFDEMYAIEEDYETTPDREAAGGGSALRRAVDAMRAVYARCWRRDDDYWDPSSVGWPSEYELSRAHDWRVYRLGPNAFRVAYRMEIMGRPSECAYDVTRFPDGLRIVDFHF